MRGGGGGWEGVLPFLTCAQFFWVGEEYGMPSGKKVMEVVVVCRIRKERVRVDVTRLF